MNHLPSSQVRRRLLSAVALSVVAGSVSAAAPDEVLFAGSSFTVDAAQIPQRFPLVSTVLAEGAGEGPGHFDQALRLAVLAANPRHFTVANQDPQAMGDTRHGIGKALSMAFSHESVELQYLDGKVVAVYDIAAQVLFFDYGAAAPHVLASYPVRFRYTDTTARTPDLAHRLAVVRTMLMSEKESGLVAAWRRKMESVIPRGGDRLVSVALPAIDAKAAAQLPSGDHTAVQYELAQFLEGVVSDEWQVPMVPVTPGQAIRGKMVQVFANGDAAEFALPEPAFTIHTTIRDLRKAAAPVDGGTRVAFGAFITLAVDGPLGRIAELRYKDVLSVTLTELVPVKLEDWAQFNQALKSVLAQSARQVTANDRSWTAANSATPQASAQLDAIRSRLLLR